jgi:hypothetical protein
LAQDAARQVLQEDPDMKHPDYIALSGEVQKLFENVGEQGLN